MGRRNDERAFKVLCWLVIVGAILNGIYGATSEAEKGRSAIVGFIGGAFCGAIVGFLIWIPISQFFD
jgi:quinol-cytochrome oxidoreductase complex cytochrome b subunit